MTFGHVQQRDGRWCIVDPVGKRGRVRTIPAPTWTKVAIDAWTAAAGTIAGPVFPPSESRSRIERKGHLAASSALRGRCGRPRYRAP